VLNLRLPAKMVEINASELTEDEAELYDRQLRLWGLDSQKRLGLTFHKFLDINLPVMFLLYSATKRFQKILI
jgi:hypothetical protein